MVKSHIFICLFAALAWLWILAGSRADDGVASTAFDPDVTAADVPILGPQIEKEVHNRHLLDLILKNMGAPGQLPEKITIKTKLKVGDDGEAMISVFININGDSQEWHKQFRELLVLYVTTRALSHTVEYAEALISQAAVAPKDFPIPEAHARMFLKVQPTVLLSKLKLKKVEEIAGYTLTTYLLVDGPTTFEYRVVAIGPTYTDVDLGAKYKTKRTETPKVRGSEGPGKTKQQLDALSQRAERCGVRVLATAVARQLAAVKGSKAAFACK